jgi:cysteinyl-tRNA synthetase
MEISFYDTYTAQKIDFKSRDKGKVYMYVCGLTPSNYPHVGHARTAVIFDVIRRIFEKNGYVVHYYSNFTDIDDKIIQKSIDEKVTTEEVARKYSEAYLHAMDQLHIKPLEKWARVTENIPEIIEMVAKLIERGFAYESDGDVYFRVKKFSSYGKLSKRSIKEMLVGARISPGEKKEDPLDFALWKAAKPGEPSWSSPWGKGRPGWHSECSAMSLKYLGNHFDIHGGAQDLIFPHHENEIAQAEAYTGISPFSRYWIHTGWVTLNREKMSKSIGNVFLISEALKVVAPNVLRFFFVETLYSSPLEYNLDQLHQASRAFERIVITMQRLEEAIHRAKTGPIDEKILRGFERLHDSFHQALAQNFNTPQGIAVIMNAVRELNKLLDTTSLALEDLKTIQHYFEDWFETLGLVDVATTELSKDEWDLMAELKALASHHHIEFSDSTTLPEMIHAFIQKREQFRQNKQYFESDTIRNDLYALKIQLEDKKEGTEYRTIP